MRLSEEQALQDNNRFANCNVLAELKYCGWEIPQRRAITNDEIRFYAWLCRSAVSLLKEQEPKQVISLADSIEEMTVGYCPSCGEGIANKMSKPTKFCRYCGQAVK